MIPELERLQASLRSIFGIDLSPPPVPRELTRLIEEMRSNASSSAAARPPSDHVRDAVIAFLRAGTLGNALEARMACFGTLTRINGEKDTPLIEHRELFPELLQQVNQFVGSPGVYRRCYKGLLDAYFRFEQDRAPADSAGRANWQVLRKYLAGGLGSLGASETLPDWVDAIREHRNLVTDDPVTRYGAALLAGDTAEFDAACDRTGVDRDSWIHRLIVIAQVQAACQLPDEEFRANVTPLVATLAKYSMLNGQGLALLLDRYALMNDRPEHPQLRDATIQEWGSPWMGSRDAAWGRVTPEARALVTSWLNLRLIQKFFDVLSEDRETDRRRVRFWQQYHGQIEEIFFALGPNAAYSKNGDVQQLRKEMGSHLLWLRGGGAANNAFIMRMGRYVIVEFGPKGNACYIFRAEDLPFRLSGEVAADRTQLKHDSRHEERLLHVDRSYETWEQSFADVLRRLGVQPASGVRETTRATRPVAESGLEPYSFTALTRWAGEHGFRIEDLSRRGGSLWIAGPPEHGPHTNRLEGWGFRWAERRQAWYRSE